ncbi:MAG: methyltransferase domain-containing protein [Epsilonproteobacteria bacterium]|nr:methyltransferase domain-containing protein [Campylobacterota bacterium]
MNIDLEFSKYAHTYAKHNIIQEQVSDELISLVKYKPKKILDLGCGRGALASRIDWDIEFFIGVDFAKNMLELHPKSKQIECIYGDFDNPELYEHLFLYDFDYILSASALQWARDLDGVFAHIAKLHYQDFAFAIFTSKTFETIHKTAGITSPLRSSDEVLEDAKRYFTCKHHINHYKLEFEDTMAMFRYIKQSGVSGNRGILSYKEIKELIRTYPLDYLEFEVLFLYS